MDAIIYKMIYKKPNEGENEITTDENFEGDDIEKNKVNPEKKEGKENKVIKLNILGREFVKNNENKCKLIINNKKHKLKEFIFFKDNQFIIDDNIKVFIKLSM